MATPTQPLDRATLTTRVAEGWRPRYLFFWGHTERGGVSKACLSQWYPARFSVDGRAFATAEHYMMFGKAELFGDEETAARILASADPREAKALGRRVRGFDGAAWDAHRVDIVVRGNLAKFSQHEPLKSFLLGSGDAVLVEASPDDTVWGIGLSERQPEARDPRAWRGDNLLGFALMRVREMLRDA